MFSPLGRVIMTNTIELEIIGKVPLYIGLGIQVIAAILLGGMVGYDREKKMKAAGLKTNILICLGATLYTVISLFNVQNNIGTDANRVGAQIVSGIGFLGAGAIIQGKGAVIGLTTAATIWVVAAIGYTIGIGYPISAGIFSITVLVVLKWINPIYQFIESEDKSDYYHVEVLSLGPVKRSVLEMIKLENIEIDEVYEDSIDKKRRILTLYIYAHKRVTERFVADIQDVASVDRVSFHQVSEDQSLAVVRNREDKLG